MSQRVFNMSLWRKIFGRQKTDGSKQGLNRGRSSASNAQFADEGIDLRQFAVEKQVAATAGGKTAAVPKPELHEVNSPLDAAGKQGVEFQPEQKELRILGAL